MGFFDFFRNVGSGINDALKSTKIISTLAPLVPLPYSGAVGKIASNLGYNKGTMRVRVRPMKKGGKVKKAKKNNDEPKKRKVGRPKNKK